MRFSHLPWGIFLIFLSFQSEVDRHFAAHGSQCLEKARRQPVGGVFSIDRELPQSGFDPGKYYSAGVCFGLKVTPAHAVTDNDVIDGYFIPKGAIVIGNTWHGLTYVTFILFADFY